MAKDCKAERILHVVPTAVRLRKCVVGYDQRLARLLTAFESS